MKRTLLAAAALLGFGFGLGVSSAFAETRVVCTLATDAASGEVLVEEGDCAGRMAPASTFKIAIALMGFDSGILTSPDAPELPFKEGYVDWRPEWKQPTTPARWRTPWRRAGCWSGIGTWSWRGARASTPFSQILGRRSEPR